MIEILPESSDGILIVRLSGGVTFDDAQAFIPKAEEKLASGGPFRCFLDWEDFEGWEPDVESDRFLFRKSHRGDFQRIAIVGDTEWEKERARLAEVIACEVRLFDPAERDAAWAWLREGTGGGN